MAAINKFLIAIWIALLISTTIALADEYEEFKVIDHTKAWEEKGITKYEGSKTCIQCHEDKVKQVFHSYHYQLFSTNEGINGKTMIFGGKIAFNDYCMAMFVNNGTKVVNWIGYITLKKAPEGYEDLVGSFTGLTGCSMCHGVGMGLPPSPQESEEQLGNIDCLACHAKPDVYVSGVLGIKMGLKNVTKDEQGRWRYVINVPTEELAKNIINKPQSKNCLACHAFSGGGPHVKRPNIAPDLLNPELAAEFDVHFKAGLGCIDCHSGKEHRFGTNSVDTWSREGESPQCSNCHTEDPHGGVFGYFLNTFHDKVACQTCHIPTIAHGEYPTEYYRDWTTTTFLPKEKRWKFAIPDPETGDTSKWYLFNNLQPNYAWYNGEREVYIFPEPVEPIPVSEVKEKIGGKIDASQIKAANGEVAGAIYYVKPTASKDDENAKIYPFKVHVAVIPYSEQNKVPVPVKAGIAFATGNITMAMKAGAKDAGIEWEPGKAVLYVRYMQVNHGVQPKDKALFCFDCHNIAGGRMHWEELGYGIYPKVAFGGILAAIIAVGIGAVWLIFRRSS